MITFFLCIWWISFKLKVKLIFIFETIFNYFENKKNLNVNCISITFISYSIFIHKHIKPNNYSQHREDPNTYTFSISASLQIFLERTQSKSVSLVKRQYFVITLNRLDYCVIEFVMNILISTCTWINLDRSSVSPCPWKKNRTQCVPVKNIVFIKLFV